MNDTVGKVIMIFLGIIFFTTLLIITKLLLGKKLSLKLTIFIVVPIFIFLVFSSFALIRTFPRIINQSDFLFKGIRYSEIFPESRVKEINTRFISNDIHKSDSIIEPLDTIKNRVEEIKHLLSTNKDSASRLFRKINSLDSIYFNSHDSCIFLIEMLKNEIELLSIKSDSISSFQNIICNDLVNYYIEIERDIDSSIILLNNYFSTENSEMFIDNNQLNCNLFYEDVGSNYLQSKLLFNELLIQKSFRLEFQRKRYTHKRDTLSWENNHRVIFLLDNSEYLQIKNAENLTLTFHTIFPNSLFSISVKGSDGIAYLAKEIRPNRKGKILYSIRVNELPDMVGYILIKMKYTTHLITKELFYENKYVLLKKKNNKLIIQRVI